MEREGVVFKNNFDLFSSLLNFTVLVVLISEAFKVIPATEGWFTELTLNKNIIQIFLNY